MNYNETIQARMQYIESLPDSEVRFHTYHLNGWTYFFYLQEQQKEFRINQWKDLIKDISPWFIISEPKPSFGYEVDGRMFNIETIFYQTVIKELWKSGVLEELVEKEYDGKILEIGGGHGQLGYHLMKITGAALTFIDLPESLLLARKYLTYHETDATFYAPDETYQIMDKFDLVIACRALSGMSEEELRGYSEFVYDHLAPNGVFYVWAGDQSMYEAGGNVSEILAERFTYQDVALPSGEKIKGNFLPRLLDISPRKILNRFKAEKVEQTFHRIYTKT